jgi:hypothetical protein
VAIYFIYASKKDIFYIPERKRKGQKKLKTSIFQAFLDKDINSSSSNFIFFTQARNRVAVIRDQLY